MDIHPVIKKLQLKDPTRTVLVLNPPKEYETVLAAFSDVHQNIQEERYPFVQVFGTSNQEIQELGRKGASAVEEDGLLWLCYPKKTSKTYKGADCNRDTVAQLLAEEGYEPVRQVAIDDDWSALRFRQPANIKTMARKSAVTNAGKARIKE